jgi:hypothetical protein
VKDGFSLLISALILAGAGWAFWRYVGQNAFGILTLVTTIFLLIDNLRMRRIISKISRSAGE